jgi:uncharacterized protein (DUF2267 family)
VRDHEFISEVASRAGLGDRAEAERAIRATLSALGEQLPDSVAASVAAALPEGLGEQVWAQRVRSRATAAQAGRLSRGVARGEGSWPGDSTTANADIDGFPPSCADPAAIGDQRPDPGTRPTYPTPYGQQ